MDFFVWQQLSEVKAGILEIASSLEDRYTDHDKAASKLFKLSMQIHELENILLRQNQTI